MQRRIALIAAAMVFMASAAVAGTLYVPGDYSAIHDAVQACATGDTVLVAPGTFYDCTHPIPEDTTKVCVIMKDGVTLRGSGPTSTIIDAQGLGRGIRVNTVGNCRIENLGITGTYADNHGAAILARYCDDTVEITDVRIFSNDDGGIICLNEASPILRRVEMYDNYAKQGGGLSIEESSHPQVYDCVIDANRAPSGAGIFIRNECDPVIDGCTITNNTVTEINLNGGGIAVQQYSSPTITNCTITDNYSQGYGGGIAFTDHCSGLVDSCFIARNEVENETITGGGGIACRQSDPILSNLVIVDNMATGYQNEGGGIDCTFNPAPTIENCTLSGNSVAAGLFGGGIAVRYMSAPTITNTIIAGSTSGQGIACIVSGNPTVTNCDIWNNAGGDAVCGTDGGGNFSLDPMFCGSPGHEYNLNPSSPCAPGNHPGDPGDMTLIGALSTGCGDVPAPLPGAEALVLGNRPNPFNPLTVIYFDLPNSGPATLRIFDLAGRLLQQRTWHDLPAGRTEFRWNGQDNDGRDLPSGIYLYRLDSRDLSSTQRMSLIR